MARSLVPSVFEVGHPATSTGADPFTLLHREVNRLFDNVLRGHDFAGGAGIKIVVPRLNVSETGQELCIQAELPGVPEQDVQVELTDDMLTIRGEKRAEHEDAEHHLAERSFGTFARTVRLPFAPRPDEVEATFEHGVLRIKLPKSAAQARRHRIPIQSGAAGMAQPGLSQHSGAEACVGTPAAVAGHPTPNTTQGRTGD